MRECHLPPSEKRNKKGIIKNRIFTEEDPIFCCTWAFKGNMPEELTDTREWGRSSLFDFQIWVYGKLYIIEL